MRKAGKYGNLPISPENIKIAEIFIICVVAWITLTGKLRKYRQTTQYEQAGTDPNTAIAIQIRQACNPSGIKLMIELDGTWENDLLLVADQIVDVAAVSTAYSKLYNENMYERLEKELNSTRFQEWLAKAKSKPTATKAASVTMVKLAAIKDTTVLSDVDSSKVAKTVKSGETIGTRLRSYNITNSKGETKLYYLVGWNSYIFLYNQGLVLASDTKEV